MRDAFTDKHKECARVFGDALLERRVTLADYPAFLSEDLGRITSVKDLGSVRYALPKNPPWSVRRVLHVLREMKVPQSRSTPFGNSRLFFQFIFGSDWIRFRERAESLPNPFPEGDRIILMLNGSPGPVVTHLYLDQLCILVRTNPVLLYVLPTYACPEEHCMGLGRYSGIYTYESRTELEAWERLLYDQRYGFCTFQQMTKIAVYRIAGDLAK